MKLLVIALWLIVIREPEFNIFAFVLTLVALSVTYYLWSFTVSALASLLIFLYYATAPTLSANLYTLIILGIYFIWRTWDIGRVNSGGSSESFDTYDISDAYE